MIKALIISSQEASRIQNLLKSSGISIATERPKSAEQIGDVDYLKRFPLALLDLDEDRWEDNLSALSSVLPVITFSIPDITRL